MKNRFVFAVAILLTGVSFAQGVPAAKKGQTAKQTQKAVPATASAPAHVAAPIPKGPTGFGPLKLGMTKAAVEALQASDGVYLSAPMVLSPLKNEPPKEGVERFEAPLITPLNPKGLKTALRFEGGQLIDLYMSFDESSDTLERVKAQIAEKYGPGIVDDDRKEEQCIYRNGSNFKITSGTVTTKWAEVMSLGVQAQTSLLDMSLDGCPSNLRDGSIGAFKMRSLSISRKAIGEEVKPKNLF